MAEPTPDELMVEVQDALRQLGGRKTISRQLVSGLYLYTGSEPATRRRQWLTRRSVQAVPTGKWNQIEHRMFSFISLNWQGQPFRHHSPANRC